jgi:hypothetical protein
MHAAAIAGYREFELYKLSLSLIGLLMLARQSFRGYHITLNLTAKTFINSKFFISGTRKKDILRHFISACILLSVHFAE